MKQAFITISFGSTFSETRIHDIGGIENALQQAFPNYDHYSTYTSGIVRKRLAEQNIIIDDPETLLNKLLQQGYQQIIIQPTHLLLGEEFQQKILSLQEKYAAKFNKFIISRPLLSSEADYQMIAAAITTQFPQLKENEGIVLMGHGSPRKNNDSFGHTYLKLQQTFAKMQLPVLIATVEDEDTPNFPMLLEALSKSSYTTVHMFPFMVVAGDHANNDMYGDDPDSWKVQIQAQGIATKGYLYGLGRNKAIQSIYINHALQAITDFDK